MVLAVWSATDTWTDRQTEKRHIEVGAPPKRINRIENIFSNYVNRREEDQNKNYNKKHNKKVAI